MVEKKKELDNDIEKLKNDFAKLRSDLSDLAVNTLERGKNEYCSARETLLHNGKKTCETVEKTLLERPLTTVLGAFGIGLLLGLIRSKRNSHKE